MTAVADLKHTHRATWAAGDYAAVAECIDDVPPADLLARVPVAPASTSSTWPPAPATSRIRPPLAGAQVVGLDLTPELLDDRAARRAERAGVDVEWIEGDAEALPFDDERLRHGAVRVRRAVRAAPPVRRRRAGARLPAGRAHRPGQLDAGRPDRPVLPGHEPATCPPRRTSPRRRRCGATPTTSARCSPAPGSSGRSRAATTRGASPPRRSGRRSWRPTTARRSRPASG